MENKTIEQFNKWIRTGSLFHLAEAYLLMKEIFGKEGFPIDDYEKKHTKSKN